MQRTRTWPRIAPNDGTLRVATLRRPVLPPLLLLLLLLRRRAHQLARAAEQLHERGQRVQLCARDPPRTAAAVSAGPAVAGMGGGGSQRAARTTARSAHLAAPRAPSAGSRCSAAPPMRAPAPPPPPTDTAVGHPKQPSHARITHTRAHPPAPTHRTRIKSCNTSSHMQRFLRTPAPPGPQRAGTPRAARGYQSPPPPPPPRESSTRSARRWTLLSQHCMQK
jgi:hypothetical protein